jgi:hypothetical protein
MKKLGAATLAALSIWAAHAHGATPEQRCQAGKNRAAGKYAFCRQNAESNLARSGDVTQYATAIALCETKLMNRWQAQENAAARAGAACPDVPLTRAEYKNVIDGHTDNIANALGGGGLQDCPADLGNCNSDLGGCNANYSSCSSDLTACNAASSSCSADLATCNADYGSCNASLGTCNANYSTCSSSLATCSDDYSTCSSSLMTCNDDYASCSADLTTCSADYASCSSSLAVCSAGTAAAADVLSGQTFSSSAGIGVTGTMANVGQQNVTPGTSPVTIAQGHHDGTGAVAGDADLTATNIRSGTVIFGVTGTLATGLLKTGQTTSYGSGSDGALQKGVVRSYTDNGDGTITESASGLMWEKKSDDGSIHDKDNAYSWGLASSPFTMNGTMVATFLAALNAGGGFAGHTDWRIPNLNELQSLANYQNGSPAIGSAFNTGCVPSCTVLTCSCTQANLHWSSTTYQGSPGIAWLVNFTDGGMVSVGKSINLWVRAVRGG